MNSIPCRECGKTIAEGLKNCPHCDTPVNPNIPRYPTLGGNGWVMNVIGIVFVTLIVALLISMFVFRD